MERSQIQRSTTTGWLSITMPKINCDMIAAQKKNFALIREEREKKAKLRAIEVAEEEAREARINQLQKRARQDAASEEAYLFGDGDDEEEKKIEEPADASMSTDKSAATVSPAERYLHPSDPAFLIQKSSTQKGAKPKKEAFVCDFDEDEVPPLE